MNTQSKSNITTTVEKSIYCHPYSNDMYFSLDVSVFDNGNFVGNTTSTWMTFNQDSRTLMESSYLDSDNYDHEHIFTSPVVNIAKHCDTTLDPYTQELHDSFSKEISKELGFDYPLPYLCHAEDAEEIEFLKLKKGYKRDGDDFYALPK
ncbi:hypothetical protein L1267_12325 [Pseudoalteromonas sp. OFAV1]|uniref:hypothetical protein n=1 Tax=Pseudoalteromonas sp. OFAV1 TaxID=2908892 RepID=UPI001F3960AC|nr:hypothetical protein [Pseudoalteromonas sp. OFAV1]MCF2901178.1 hypothetical protein [Pseudoalteromonas sp. OFAV1]